MDIDKILKVIQRKVLKGTHLPVEIKEKQAGYLHSSYFKDLYLYLSHKNYPFLGWGLKELKHLQKYTLY